MEKYYKDLYLTDELHKALKAKIRGEYVVLCLPLLDAPSEAVSMMEFPYCIENLCEVEDAYLNRVLCRLKGGPCDILHTRRCLLREMRCEDLDRLYEIYEDDEIRSNMEPLYADRQEELKYIRDYIRCQYGFYDFGMWVLQERRSGRVIGRAGIDLLDIEKMHEGEKEGLKLYALKETIPERADFPVELGFVMDRDFRRQGFSFEVCRAILHYIEETLPQAEVYARVKGSNTASLRLLEKLGFHALS